MIADNLGFRNIEDDGISCLTENNYEVKDRGDSFVTLKDGAELCLFVKGYKNDKAYTFEMKLSDDALHCDEDSKITLDMSKYKNNFDRENQLLKDMKTKREELTPQQLLEKLISEMQSISDALSFEEKSDKNNDSVKIVNEYREEIKELAKKHSLEIPENLLD